MRLALDGLLEGGDLSIALGERALRGRQPRLEVGDARALVGALGGEAFDGAVAIGDRRLELGDGGRLLLAGLGELVDLRPELSDLARQLGLAIAERGLDRLDLALENAPARGFDSVLSPALVGTSIPTLTRE